MKMIKIKNVIFNHQHFYDLNEIDINHLLNVFVENVMQMLKLFEIFSIFETENQISNYMLNDLFDSIDQSKRQEPADQANDQIVDHQDKKFIVENSIQLLISKLISDFEIIRNVEIISTMFAINQNESIESTTIVQSTYIEISKNVSIMNTKSRKNAYKIALNIVVQMIFYHATFSIDVERYEVSNQPRFHRNDLSFEFRH